MQEQALIQIGDIERMAAAVAASKLFGCKTKEEAMALMLVSQAEGMHPMTAVQEFHIISGRPARKAEAVLARFQKAGGKVSWPTYSDTRVVGIFSHPQGGEVTVEWNIGKANKVKSWDKEEKKMVSLSEKLVWKNYPAAMLRSRCIVEGVRTVYPGAFGGIQVVEELEDLPPKDMGPAERVMPQPTASSDADAGMQPQNKVEPMPPDDESGGPQEPEAQATSPVALPEGEPIVSSAIKIVSMKLAAAGKSDKDLKPSFGVDKVEDLKQNQVNAVLDWIRRGA